jgi:uncharacterized protein YbjT (DUF2867 family)
MRVGILGGTGFVGSYLVEALLKHDHQPVLLVRPGSEDRAREHARCELVSGDVGDAAAVGALVEQTAAVIYNIGILRELPSRGITFEAMHWHGAKTAIDLAVEAGGRRFLLMSANGVRADGTGYQRTKYEAEEYLRTSALDFTIFRPSVIFGPPRGRMEIATQLNRDIIQSPLPAPLFFQGLLPTDPGGFELAPIHVVEVAEAFAQALADASRIGATLLLCGPEDLSWREMLTRIARTVGRSQKLMLPVPAGPVALAAGLLDRFPAFPLTADQLQMLLEGNTCRGAEGELVRGRRRFDEESLSYLITGA